MVSGKLCLDNTRLVLSPGWESETLPKFPHAFVEKSFQCVSDQWNRDCFLQQQSPNSSHGKQWVTWCSWKMVELNQMKRNVDIGKWCFRIYLSWGGNTHCKTLRMTQLEAKTRGRFLQKCPTLFCWRCSDPLGGLSSSSWIVNKMSWLLQDILLHLISGQTPSPALSEHGRETSLCT